MPPKYSEQLTLQNINLMFLAPILGLMVNFWAFGNRQMFENKIDAISTQGEISYSHHVLTHLSSMPIYPHLEQLLYGFIISILFIICVGWYFNILRVRGQS